MDGILVSATKNGQYKVERIFENVVQDRFIFAPMVDYSARCWPKWIKDAHALLTQPSADVVIQVPPVPPIDRNVFEELRYYHNELYDCGARLANAVQVQSLLLSFLLRESSTALPSSAVLDATSNLPIVRQAEHATAE